MGRSPCCDKGKVKRGPWSPEEDAVLRSYIDRHGTGGNWIALPHKAGLKRCGKSCRLRWLNYLRPDVKHGGFSDEEDHVICTLYRELGSRWATIASKLPGRTDNEVKNHWNTKLKKRMTAAAPAEPLNPTTSPVHLRPSSPAIKTEPYSCGGFSNIPTIGPGFSFYHGTSMMGLAEPPDLSGSMNGSFASTPNSASSSVTADSSAVGGGGGGGGYAHWPGSGALGDEAFLSELGFGSLTELLSGYRSAPTIADMWAVTAEATAEPQGRYKGLTFS